MADAAVAYTRPLPMRATQAGTLAYGMTLPAPVPMPAVPPLNYQPPTGGPAPTPTPYGTFTAPDHATFNRSADSLYLQDQQQKALQRSAMARGTLLSGGFAKALQANAEGLAGQDYQNEYNRQLGTYTANRDTNAQNFGQQRGAYTATTNANLGYGRLGLEAASANHASAYQNAQDQRDYLQQLNDYNAGMNNLGSLGGYGGGSGGYGGGGYGGGLGDYQQQVERQRAEAAANAQRVQAQKQAEAEAARSRFPYRSPLFG